MVQFVGMVWSLLFWGARRWRRWLLAGVIALLNVGCGAAPPATESSIRAKYKFGVCTHDPDIETIATDWAYRTPEAPAVSNLHPAAFHRAILESGVAYHYDPFAPAHSVKVLPIRHSQLSCDRMHKLELEVAALRPCSGDICALSLPNEITLPNDSGVCRLENAQSNASLGRKNWLGESGGPPIRSRYFCETEPVVPRNATVRVLDKEGEIAWLEGYSYGYRVSLLLTQAEADAQAFINHSDPWIIKLFKKDPGSVDAIMLRVASALDAIPEPPQYDREYTAMLAADGYASGSRHGAFDVEAKLVLIEAAATVAEVALMEIAMGPLGGANVLRAAVSRLGNIPIFIPGAVGGLGGAMKVGSLVKAAKKAWSSKKLGAALIKAGKVRLDGHEAHHIVAGGHEWAEPAQEVLKKFGIKLDDAVNGVFLPGTMKSPNPLGSQVHRPLSNLEAYYKKVNKELVDLTTKKEVIAALRKIADELTKGTFL